MITEKSTASFKAEFNFFVLSELLKVVEIKLSFSHYNADATKTYDCQHLKM